MTEPGKPESLGEALPSEMARVRDEVMPAYRECGAGGLPALMMMRQALDGAAKALAEGDTVAMIRWYRVRSGLSLSGAAELLGMSRKHLSDLENGRASATDAGWQRMLSRLDDARNTGNA